LPEIKHFGPPKFLGWLRHWAATSTLLLYYRKFNDGASNVLTRSR